MDPQGNHGEIQLLLQPAIMITTFKFYEGVADYNSVSQEM